MWPLRGLPEGQMKKITTLLQNERIPRPSEYQRNPGWGPDGEWRDSLRFSFLEFNFAVLTEESYL